MKKNLKIALGIVLSIPLLWLGQIHGEYDGASDLYVSGVVTDAETGQPVHRATVSFTLSSEYPPYALARSDAAGSFEITAKLWPWNAQEYLFLLEVSHFSQFCLRITAPGYEEKVVEYEPVPRSPYSAKPTRVDTGTITLAPLPTRHPANARP